MAAGEYKKGWCERLREEAPAGGRRINFSPMYQIYWGKVRKHKEETRVGCSKHLDPQRSAHYGGASYACKKKMKKTRSNACRVCSLPGDVADAPSISTHSWL